MDFYGFLRMVLRQKLIIAVVMIATVIAAGVVTTLQPASYQTTLLYSTGISSETQITEGFDATKLADDFANTVSGWLRSPDFTKRLSDLASAGVSISGETQAKQNFLINLSYKDSEATSRISSLAERMLKEEIDKYNQSSKLKFFATLHGETNSANTKNLPLTLIVAAFGGFLLAIGWILLMNILGGKVTSAEEAEQLLGIKAEVNFSCASSEEVNFLEALVKKIGSNATLLGADLKLDKLMKKLKNNPKNGSLPNEASLLVKSEARPIIVVKLDTTRISTLRQIKAIAEKDLHLVVWG